MDLEELRLHRETVKEIFEKNLKEVETVGWVSNTRELGKIKFLVLRDNTGSIQVTAVKGKAPEKVFDSLDKISRESVIYIRGAVKESKQAPGGKEINPSVVEILNPAENLPIDVSDFSKTDLPKRLDNRFLDMHRQKIEAIFRIQSELAFSFREFFHDKNFMEVQLPSVISASSEGGTELFKVQYFEKKAYLAQSPQLYKQMIACTPVEKVFTITPVWRAEKHNTIRHLNESRQMDVEVAFAGQMEIMKLEEEVVQYMISQVMRKCKEEIEVLGLNLKVPKAKYLSYDETVKLLGMKYGEDLTPDDERELDKKFPDTIVFIHSWPTSIKPFYIMPRGEKADAKLSEGFDAIYRGTEITSGGQRIHLPELLIKRLKAKKLNPKDFKGYIDSFRYGAPPHAGWSIGLERLTMLVTEQKNIREAVLFPRDRDRLTP